jgi:putative hydrolase of the HAD superfamily
MSASTLKSVIFDLDDTLYEEREYFRSGFAAVAENLERRGVGPRGGTAELLDYFHHAEGRQQVFQKLALRLGFPQEWVPEIVELFRTHRPVIALAADARELLPRLRTTTSLRLGCVTDGWLAVQRRKVEALGVESFLDALVISDEFGRDFWKPHAKPFLACCARLGVKPAEAVFVGDNPERDMVGARRAGLASIRIRRPGGYFEATELPGNHARADFEIRQLTELETLIAQFQGGSPATSKAAVIH